MREVIEQDSFHEVVRYFNWVYFRVDDVCDWGWAPKDAPLAPDTVGISGTIKIIGIEEK